MTRSWWMTHIAAALLGLGIVAARGETAWVTMKPCEVGSWLTVVTRNVCVPTIIAGKSPVIINHCEDRGFIECRRGEAEAEARGR